MFTLLIPFVAHLFKFSSPEEEPPCKTNGVSIVAAISFNLSKSITGVAAALYEPWAVPIDIASESTPVASTNAFASAAVVYILLLFSWSSYSSPSPTWPISASTTTPLRWA